MTSKKTKFLTIFLSIVIVCTLASIVSVILVRRNAIETSRISYEELSSQREFIKENFNNVYSYNNYVIAPADEGYKVTLSAPYYDIAMICNFDIDFNYVDSTYIEPVIIENLIIYILIFVVFGFVGSLVVIWTANKLFD